MGLPPASRVVRVDERNGAHVENLLFRIVFVQNAIIEGLNGPKVVLQMVIVGCQQAEGTQLAGEPKN